MKIILYSYFYANGKNKGGAHVLYSTEQGTTGITTLVCHGGMAGFLSASGGVEVTDFYAAVKEQA